jgi:hypothetical protein
LRTGAHDWNPGGVADDRDSRAASNTYVALLLGSARANVSSRSVLAGRAISNVDATDAAVYGLTVEHLFYFSLAACRLVV